jgi:[NiFe] hydrogenase assembly HybE family chaperone
MTESESRIQELVDQFRRIGQAQMRDLPIYNACLEVEAVGFQAFGDRWIGVLITPWFMNVILLPSEKTPLNAKVIGQKSQEALPVATCAFIGGGDETVGSYKSLALYSPMAAFISQGSARHEAQACLIALLTPPAELPKQAVAPILQETPQPPPSNLSRRAFLCGRRNA